MKEEMLFTEAGHVQGEVGSLGVYHQECSFVFWGVFWPHPAACRILSSLSRDLTHAPCGESMES